MIQLGKQPVATPPVRSAANALDPGAVYIAGDTTPFASELPDGKHVVLASAGGSAELTTSATIGRAVTAGGTYVDASQFSKVGNWGNPTLRLYTFTDTWRKILAAPGILLLLTTLAGVVAAFVGLIGIWGANPTGASTVSDRGRTVLEWSVAPVEQLDSDSSPREIVAARQHVQRRRELASECLAQLASRDTPKPEIPGVNCKPDSPPWWKNTDTVTWVTLIVGALTALLSLVGLGKNFGFGKSPAAS